MAKNGRKSVPIDAGYDFLSKNYYRLFCGQSVKKKNRCDWIGIFARYRIKMQVMSKNTTVLKYLFYIIIIAFLFCSNSMLGYRY